MEKKNEINAEIISPDLKHDTMEYAAPLDGEDILDAPVEEEEITPEELDALYADNNEEETEALNTATIDSMLDEDNFLIEPDQLDELESPIKD